VLEICNGLAVHAVSELMMTARVLNESVNDHRLGSRFDLITGAGFYGTLWYVSDKFYLHICCSIFGRRGVINYSIGLVYQAMCFRSVRTTSPHMLLYFILFNAEGPRCSLRY